MLVSPSKTESLSSLLSCNICHMSSGSRKSSIYDLVCSIVNDANDENSYVRLDNSTSPILSKNYNINNSTFEMISKKISMSNNSGMWFFDEGNSFF